VRLLGGLAQGKDLFEVASSVVDLHPRHNTFPGEVYMGLAADALELAGADRDDPIAYQALLDEYLAECEFRGWDKRKIQYAILAGAAFRGGIKPDLLNGTAWRTDDYWRYALSQPWQLSGLVLSDWKSQCPSLRSALPSLIASSSRRESSVVPHVGDRRGRISRQAALPRRNYSSGSAAGAGYERGDDVCGVTVEGLSRPVVAHCGSRVGMRCGLLNIAESDPGVQSCGNE